MEQFVNRMLFAATLWVLVSMGMSVNRAAADPPNPGTSAGPYATGSGPAPAAASSPRLTPDRRPAGRALSRRRAARRRSTCDSAICAIIFTPAELESPLPDMIGDEIVVEGTHSTAP